MKKKLSFPTQGFRKKSAKKTKWAGKKNDKKLSDSLKRNAEQLPKSSKTFSMKQGFLKSGVRKKTTKRRAAPERPTRKHLFASENKIKQDAQNKNETSVLGHRLQKVLAAAGFGSRRECEELIASGRVEVDHKIVTELGVRVFPMNQEIRVDGETLKKTKPIYLALYKPKGYVCTHYDPERRPRAIDLIPEKMGRVFPIGRLDLESEGLLLMTNDGALSERLTHPKYEASKCYRVQVAGLIEPVIVQQLKKGVWLAEGHAKASYAVIKGVHKNSSILEIELKEGKNREIRRLLARLGHKVLSLKRIAVGTVRLGKLIPGEYRLLTNSEVDKLYNATQ